MVGFRLPPRYRRPSLGEFTGITQSRRRLSRKHHLRTLLDPASPLKNAERRIKYRMGYYSEPAKFARFVLRFFARQP
jgi:hypothetical protein